MSAKTIVSFIRRRRLCRECGVRPARFCFRGVVKRDRKHDLCLQCWRSLKNQVNGGAPSRYRFCGLRDAR